MQISQKTLNLQPAYCSHADLTESLHQSAMGTCEHSLLGHYISVTTYATSAAGMQHAAVFTGLFCFFLKSLLPFYLLRRLRVRVMLLQRHSAELKAASTVLIIGGGAVGVELAGKLPLLSVYVYLHVCLSVCIFAACPYTCLSVAFPYPACLPACAHLTCPDSVWLSLHTSW